MPARPEAAAAATPGGDRRDLPAAPAAPPESDFAGELRRRLAASAAAGLERALRPPSGVDFCSNDYLGLSRDPEVRRDLLARLAALAPDEPLGAPSSRLLRGHTRLHADLERRLAAWKGTEAALLFPSGYQANIGVLTALLGPADRALSDAHNHASLIDGLRLAGCRRVVYPHLDLAAIERELALPHLDGRTFLVTESLFSMDGDIAPLDSYAALAESHGAELIVDDAHATGLFGDQRGSGLCEALGVARRALAVVSTLGKAIGFSGAFAAGPRAVCDYLINRCRPFIFTTAPPPLLLHALAVALDCQAGAPERRRRVLALAARLRLRLHEAGIPCPPGSGPIVPVLLGDNRRAVAAAERLGEQGFDVRAIRPPTVPPGTARLRISVHADHSEAEIDALALAVAAALASSSSSSSLSGPAGAAALPEPAGRSGGAPPASAPR
ncbi:MAG TPA: 8-amino-7-oxononanoate synthase [Thermoanaerobaculia bacterium]|nr:8-amino-7-oxononanoate synthase [Thermoanaerobaculia bacterium]